MDDMKWQQMAPIFLVGVGLGAAIGVLFAPKSGEETRDQISGALNDGMNEISAQGARLSRQARTAVQGIQDNARDAMEAGNQAYREARNAAGAS